MKNKITPPEFEGQYKRGKSIGYAGNIQYLAVRCESCGKLRWTECKADGTPRRKPKICLQCISNQPDHTDIPQSPLPSDPPPGSAAEEAYYFGMAIIDSYNALKEENARLRKTISEQTNKIARLTNLNNEYQKQGFSKRILPIAQEAIASNGEGSLNG